MKGPLVIWGCGGHGREVNHLCGQAGLEVAGFLDERPEMKGRVVDDVPVLGDIADIPGLKGRVVVFPGGVGDPALKRRFLEKTLAAGFDLSPALVHPAVRLSRRVELAPGALVAEGCILTVNVRVGAHATLNRAVNLSHDVEVGAFATLSPGVMVSGNVSIGEGAFIGTNAAIREKTRVGAWSVVGGGAFVASEVPERALVAGVPARWKKDL